MKKIVGLFMDCEDGNEKTGTFYEVIENAEELKGCHHFFDWADENGNALEGFGVLVEVLDEETIG